jgi:hypothetical protein
MQSMGADASAFHQLLGAAGVTSPFNASTAGMRSSLGRTRLGAEHVLGVQKIATARFPMAVVLVVQDLCLQRAQEAATADDKLFCLYTAFYVVVNTMALRNLVPQIRVPGLLSFRGGFCRFAPNL